MNTVITEMISDTLLPYPGLGLALSEGKQWQSLVVNKSQHHPYRQPDWQTDKQTNKQADRQTDKQNNKEADRQTDKQTNKQADRQTNGLTSRK